MYSQYAIMTIQYANMAGPIGIVSPGKFKEETAIDTDKFSQCNRVILSSAIDIILHTTF